MLVVKKTITGLISSSIVISSIASAITLYSGNENSISDPFNSELNSALLSSSQSVQLTSGLNVSIIQSSNELVLTHGVAAGDVTENSAVIWARANTQGIMHVLVETSEDEYTREAFTGEESATEENEQQRHKHKKVSVISENDFTGKLEFNNLKPGTEYNYKVWFGSAQKTSSAKTSGRFQTAPEHHKPSAVSFAWGGDVAGQNVCRDVQQGFPIFNAINQMPLDFFIGLGDMIYADGICESTGLYGNAQVPGDFDQAANMKDYWAHWKYNREDKGYRELLSKMPYYAIWDDHEVVNDFGPLHDTRSAAPYTPGVHLTPMGLKAFMNYNPIVDTAKTPKRLYRNIRWGQHLEMFILDARQYRDANLALDSQAQPKTMLGREQLTWLKEKLKASDATWKVIVSSVPVSIPTGAFGRDGWANFEQETGFENELKDILRTLQQKGEQNVLFVTTDVHFAEAFRYTPFMDDAGFQVHEFVSGPLNAGLFPNHDYDSSLGTESLFFFGPQSASDVTTYEQAKQWFNYGSISINEQGQLSAAIRNIEGEAVYEISLDAK